MIKTEVRGRRSEVGKGRRGKKCWDKFPCGNGWLHGFLRNGWVHEWVVGWLGKNETDGRKWEAVFSGAF